MGFLAVAAHAQVEPPAVTPTNPPLPPGHSTHGGAFNEGPRRHAYLMKGLGKVDFPVTTKDPLAQKFFNQGVAQLHGFWYFEAERSFRQVAALDPDCAMAYWGMAMANVNNESRAREFLAKAVEIRAKAGPHERMWIDGLAAYYKPGQEDKTRKRAYVKSLEAIVKRYPDDLEAKAYMCLQIWEDGGTIPIFSRAALDARMREVLAKNPMHPLHHYIIHLWDGPNAAKALTSAARCGPSSPTIAHMWHMPGHIYSDLHRYADAAWQQEASARTDHAHMIQDWVLPDQIFNYAHNNQWLIEDLDYIGRVHDAVDLAENMIDLPRHPSYNTLGGRGSASEGRRRLFQVLMDYELWDDLIKLSQTDYLEPTDLPDQQIKRLNALGVAYFSKGDAQGGQEQVAALEAILKREQRARAETGPKPGEKKPEKALTDFQVKTLEADLDELKGYAALARGDEEEAGKRFAKLEHVPKERLAQLYLKLGDKQRAETLARDAVKDAPNQVQPLAHLVEILHQVGKKDDARAEFKKLQALSGSIDLDAPIFQRLAPIALELGSSADWRVPTPRPADVGWRPALDSLGPFRWHPMPAPSWTLPDMNGRRISLQDFRRQGRPVLVIFYLGSGCAQCIQQLNIFAPAAKEFEAAGISLVAIGADTPEGLKHTFAKSEGGAGFPFPLLSDQDRKVFKTYHAYDAFEKMPLHGTFLVDGKGQVRWLDISYQPFKETGFLLAEAKRLLKQAEVAHTLPPKQLSAE